jgi:glycosyltransferase involved in cell wall biosynthesis
MKRVLVITPFFYPHQGGSEEYMLSLYSYIKKRNRDIIVDVLCYNTNNSSSYEVYRGLNIIRIPCFTILKDQFCLVNPFYLCRFLLSSPRYDLIHISTRFFDSAWWGVVLAKIKKTKVFLTDHCANHPVSNNPLVSFFAKIIDDTIVRFFLHFYDRVFCESQSTCRFLKNHFGIHNIEIAYPGIDFYNYKNKRRQRNNIPRVIFVGRMIESKGVRFILGLAKEMQNVNFVLVGGGPLLSWLRKEQKKEGLYNLEIKGALKRRDVFRMLRSSDIFAYPSQHSEGLPFSLIEAGLFKLPVVAFDTGGVGEIIINGSTGFCIEKGDKENFKKALFKLTSDKKLRDKLGQNLYKMVISRFSWEKAASQITKEIKG